MHVIAPFLGALFASYPPGRYLELRALPAREGEPVRRLFVPLGDPGRDARAMSFARQWRATHHVCFGVLPRTNPRRGGADDLSHAGWLWADMDREEAERPSWLPHPNLLVHSGRGRHLYWRLPDCLLLTSPAQRASFAGLLRRLAHVLGADPGSTDAAHLLRLPGTLNHKRHPAEVVQLLHCQLPAANWPLTTWEAKLPPLPTHRVPSSLKAVALPDALARFLAEAAVPAPVGRRALETRSLLYRARLAGAGLAELQQIADQKARASGWEETEKKDALVRRTVVRILPDPYHTERKGDRAR